MVILFIMSVYTKLSGNLPLNGKILNEFIGSKLAYKRSQLFSSNRQVFLLFTWHMTVECCLTWLGFIYTLYSGCYLAEFLNMLNFQYTFFLLFTYVFWTLRQTSKPRLCTVSLWQHGYFKINACSSLWRANCFSKSECLFTNCSLCSSHEIMESSGRWMWEDKPADTGTATVGLFTGP